MLMHQMVLLLSLILLPGVVCQSLSTMYCPGNDPFYVPHEWNEPGDLLIGAMASHLHFFFPKFLFDKPPTQETLNMPFSVTKFYQHILALVFAIDEINENPQILPNMTLGFHIYDSYSDSRMTYRNTLDLLFTSTEFTPNYKCGGQKNTVGVIGGLSYDTTQRMADLLSLYKVPQISYGSFESAANHQIDFPFVVRVVPNQAVQYQGLVQLFLHFGWKWVGLLASEDESGDRFLRTIEPMLSKEGICSAFTERLSNHLYSGDNIIETLLEKVNIFTTFITSEVAVVVVHGETPTITWVTAAIGAVDILNMVSPLTGKAPTAKVWVTTAQIDFILSSIHKIVAVNLEKLHGAISFMIHSKKLQGFQEFLERVHPSWDSGDGFVRNFWSQAFTCLFSTSGVLNLFAGQCTGEEKLENLPAPFFERTMTGHSYSIYNAVYALAHALHAMDSSRTSHRSRKEGWRLSPQKVEPWQVISTQ